MVIQGRFGHQRQSNRDQAIQTAIDAHLDGDEGLLNRLGEKDRIAARCRLARLTLGKREELGL